MLSNVWIQQMTEWEEIPGPITERFSFAPLLTPLFIRSDIPSQFVIELGAGSQSIYESCIVIRKKEARVMHILEFIIRAKTFILLLGHWKMAIVWMQNLAEGTDRPNWQKEFAEFNRALEIIAFHLLPYMDAMAYALTCQVGGSTPKCYRDAQKQVEQIQWYLERPACSDI